MDDRLKEIKARHVGPFRFYQRVQPDDLTWLIEQIELLRAQLATLEARAGVTPGMVSEIEDAHRTLDELGVPNDGKSLLSERLELMGSSTYTPVAEALTVLYEMWCKLGLQDTETIAAMAELLTAYDEWLG